MTTENITKDIYILTAPVRIVKDGTNIPVFQDLSSKYQSNYGKILSKYKTIVLPENIILERVKDIIVCKIDDILPSVMDNGLIEYIKTTLSEYDVIFIYKSKIGCSYTELSVI